MTIPPFIAAQKGLKVSCTEAELESMAKTLNASGRYRVLRKLGRRTNLSRPDGVDVRLGLFVDVETTGLDPKRDEIIELAMLPFTYGLDGHIYEVHDVFHKYRQPRGPIPSTITALTGITDEMVAGQAITAEEITAFATESDLIVAHNSTFDRRFLERICDVFTMKPWACSMTQIDWVAEGFDGLKLAYLAAGAGFFYDQHRAADDCAAAIELLSISLPKSGVPAMRCLLERARLPSWRIWAENSSFDLKDVLKARGYQWNGDDDSSPRSWYIDVDDNQKEAELSYLRTEIYRREVDIFSRRITAFNRFSGRC